MTSNSTARDVGDVVQRADRCARSRSCRRARRGARPWRRRWPATRPGRRASRRRAPRPGASGPCAEVNGRDSGRNEWAAAPAKSPRASSVEKARPATVAGRTPRSPKPASVSGWRGTRSSGASTAGASVVPAAGGPADVPVPGPAVRAEALRPCRRATGGARRRGRRRAGGRGRPRGGPARGRGARGRPPAKNGDTAARGWMAEHTSWWKPGQRQLRGAGPAADGVGGLEDEHRAARLRARDRGGQPVRTGSHDHDIGHVLSLGCS